MFHAAAIVGIFLSAGIAAFDAPVTIDCNFVFSCLDTLPQPPDPLHLSGNWNAEYFGPSLPVYITVPDRPALILFTVSSSDEVQGYLLSCTGYGTVTDSMLVYYWNSEGFETRTCRVTPEGRIYVTTLRDYDVDECILFNFNGNGSFTPVHPPDTSTDGSLEN